MRKITKPLLAFSMLFLSGCSSDFWNVGESSFTCEEVPMGFGCSSTIEAYQKTGGSIESIETANEIEAASSDNGQIQVATRSQRAGMAMSLAPEPSFGTSQIPIRTPAKILRVWIAPFEGKNGALFMPGLVYREIQPRTWQVGHENQSVNHHSSPLTTSER